MSDPAALVCVREPRSDEVSARRWRRRGVAAHSVREPVRDEPPGYQRRRRGLARLLLFLVAGGAGWAAVTAAVAHSGGSAFSRRVSSGCEELEPCLSLEAEAERRRDACSLWCGREAAELAVVRQMRFRAEERRAVREHYRERDRVENVERQRRRDERREEWEREQRARAAEASREQRHRLELERLRQEHIDRRLAEERQRRVRYFTALGPEGRALRLERCVKKSGERCDALALDLLEATSDAAERRRLAEVNEGVAHASAPPSAAGTGAMPAADDARPAVSAGQSPVEAPAASEPIALPSS